MKTNVYYYLRHLLLNKEDKTGLLKELKMYNIFGICFSILIVLLAASQTAMAQQDESTQKSLYAELLGASNLIGVSYDSRLRLTRGQECCEIL